MIASAVYRDNTFKNSFPVRHPEELEDAKLLVLWGGEDISPSLYGQRPNRRFVHASAEPSVRDLIEVRLAQAAKEQGIPILGVCRGAQLLCALNGGTLFQHAANHAGPHHNIRMNDGRVIPTNSLHHQVMRPPQSAEILGWSEEILSPVKHTEDDTVVGEIEPEIVFFPEWKALGVQGHPEYLTKSHPLCQETARIVKERFNVELY